MNAESRLLLTGIQRAEDLLRRIANGDQQAVNTAGDLADDLEALLQESGRPTIAVEQNGREGTKDLYWKK